MRKLFLAFSLTLLSLYTFAWKGTIVQKLTAPGGGNAVTITWYVTDNDCKMKMDFSDGNVNTSTFFIPDLATSKLITYAIGGSQKQVFYSIPVAGITADKSMNASRVSVEKTGETKQIQGFTCEKVITKTNKNITETWVTTSFKPSFYKYYAFFRSSYELMGLYEDRVAGFPISSVTKSIDGSVISQTELVSATATELSDKDFKVPDGYVSAESLSSGKN
jgi:hypothetical protein